MADRYEIVWTEPAVEDLEEILAYIRERSPVAAERMGAAILKRVGMLASFPFLGAAYPTPSATRHREISYKKYRIFYRVREDDRRVEILTVWHGARDEPDFEDRPDA